MDKEEQKILEEIARSLNLKPAYFETLFKIEKRYADRNMSRRRGIFQEILSQIDLWVKEG